ncbi:serine-enriched protein-like [Haliotis rubra]|uniref:serine-enriched protein-like n=1 Tax=Haliotis rubra TaxID=36100 RepID=UPI001EE556F2|nr:serine-enriched protein-like [Haliotis rubra]
MPEMCDVTFLVGRRHVPIYGVKAILATRSRCLYQLILHHQRKAEAESSNKKSKKGNRSPLPQKLMIDVQDYSVEDFRKFITFVHSGKVKIDINNVIGLLCASVEYGFPDLQTACTKFIQRSQDHGEGKHILDSAWNYQHKRVSQKLICKLTSQPKVFN